MCTELGPALFFSLFVCLFSLLRRTLIHCISNLPFIIADCNHSVARGWRAKENQIWFYVRCSDHEKTQGLAAQTPSFFFRIQCFNCKEICRWLGAWAFYRPHFMVVLTFSSFKTLFHWAHPPKCRKVSSHMSACIASVSW